MGVYTHMMFFNPRSAIAESYLQMARLIGCTDNLSSLYKFELENSSIQLTEKMLTDRSISQYIVVNPNASDLRIERRWPAGNYVNLIDRLIRQLHQHSIVLIGNKTESEYVKMIYDQIDPSLQSKVLDMSGKQSIDELFALIARADLVVTNDTGPMHVAFALQRPTVALFGPASPAQFGKSNNVYGVYMNVYCSPCVHDFLTPPCFGDNQCMKQIEVSGVEKLVLDVLRQQVSAGTIHIEPMHYFTQNRSALGRIERK
jgi:ADP-heptose:LPS heptosyltransferase